MIALAFVLAGLSSSVARAPEKPLRATVEGRSTTFRLYAPKATSVRPVVYPRYDSESGNEVPMTMRDDGVGELAVENVGFGTYYGYRIDGPRDDPAAERAAWPC